MHPDGADDASVDQDARELVEERENGDVLAIVGAGHRVRYSIGWVRVHRGDRKRRVDPGLKSNNGCLRSVCDHQVKESRHEPEVCSQAGVSRCASTV